MKYYLYRCAPEVYWNQPGPMFEKWLWHRMGVLLFRDLEDPYVNTFKEHFGYETTDQVKELHMVDPQCPVCEEKVDLKRGGGKVWLILMCGNQLEEEHVENWHLPTTVHVMCLMSYTKSQINCCYPIPCPMNPKEEKYHAIRVNQPEVIFHQLYQDKDPNMANVRHFFSLVLEMVYNIRIEYLMKSHKSKKRVLKQLNQKQGVIQDALGQEWQEKRREEQCLTNKQVLLCGPLFAYIQHCQSNQVYRTYARAHPYLKFCNQECGECERLLALWWPRETCFQCQGKRQFCPIQMKFDAGEISLKPLNVCISDSLKRSLARSAVKVRKWEWNAKQRWHCLELERLKKEDRPKDSSDEDNDNEDDSDDDREMWYWGHLDDFRPLLKKVFEIPGVVVLGRRYKHQPIALVKKVENHITAFHNTYTKMQQHMMLRYRKFSGHKVTGLLYWEYDFDFDEAQNDVMLLQGLSYKKTIMDEEDEVFKSIKKVVTQSSFKFKTRSVDYTFVTEDVQKMIQNGGEERSLQQGRMWIELVLERAFEYIWEEEDLQRQDQVSLSISGGDLTYPVVIPYHAYQSPAHQRQALLESIHRVQQSKKEWLMGRRWNTVHEVKWKIQCLSEETTLVFWITPEQQWYEVRNMPEVYGKRVKVCLKCGKAYSASSQHRCQEEQSLLIKTVKRKAHFKCTENELRRKRCRYDPAEKDDLNCLAGALRQALKEWKCVENHDDEREGLLDWVTQWNMEKTWNESTNLETVKEWSEKLNQRYPKRFQLVVYDQTLRKVLARYSAVLRHGSLFNFGPQRRFSAKESGHEFFDFCHDNDAL
ncbi:hypothetical protein AC249_AIPGENE9400 [Exaiptasia diaphana]|nr:hypothetical protein AC249_AIPGENE9400 [Exaiptasia diaphana]